MRVATNQFSNSLINQLGKLSTRQERLHSEAASGKRLQSVADDPVATRRLLDLQAESGAVAQYQKNIGRLQDSANAGYSSLRSVQKISGRAGEIATLADGLKTPEQLRTYATEVNKLIDQAVSELNRKQGDSYLFGGTRTDQPPFTVEKDANGQITAVTFEGNTAGNPSEIAAGVALTANVPGANSSGEGARGLVADSRHGADFFGHLISLRDNLLAGNTQAIADTSRAELAADEDNLLYHLGEYGATLSQLETANASAAHLKGELMGETSRTADADLAETLVRLNETQTAYQATLQSASKLMNLSLMDYLR